MSNRLVTATHAATLYNDLRGRIDSSSLWEQGVDGQGNPIPGAIQAKAFEPHEGFVIAPTASAMGAHAEGGQSVASGPMSHAEGLSTASSQAAHAEGAQAEASGMCSHAEGMVTKASGSGSHAEGAFTIAAGAQSHVVGINNIADSYDNWPEWTANTAYAVGDKVKITETENNTTFVDGYVCKTANSDSTFTRSKWTPDDGLMNYVEIVGNGTDLKTRSNARTLDWEGNAEFAGDVVAGGCGGASPVSLKAVAAAVDGIETLLAAL